MKWHRVQERPIPFVLISDATSVFSAFIFTFYSNQANAVLGKAPLSHSKDHFNGSKQPIGLLVSHFHWNPCYSVPHTALRPAYSFCFLSSQPLLC